MKIWKRSISVIVVVFFMMLIYSVVVLAGEDPKLPPSEVAPDLPIEIISKRSEFSKTFLNPDGSFTTEWHSEPLFYQDEKGLFVEINPRVTEVRDGKKVSFYADQALYQATFGNVEEGYTVTYHNKTLKVQPLEIESVFDALQDMKTLLYRRAWNSADLVYDIESDCIKEKIVLYSKNAPITYKFRCTLPNDTTVTKVDGGLQVVGEDGLPLFFLADPFAFDQVSELPSFDVVSVSYKLNGQELLITYNIDETWLYSNERIFPVTIDPPVYTVNSSRWEMWIDVDQTITYEYYMYMPAMRISYASDYFRITLGETNVVEHILWNNVVKALKEHQVLTNKLAGGKKYIVSQGVGNGWIPCEIIYGQVWSKVTYYQQPVVVDGFKGGVFKTPPQLSWTLKYADTLLDYPQKNYVIALSKNSSLLTNLDKPQEVKETNELKVISGGTTKYCTPPQDKIKGDGAWYYRIAVYNGGVWSNWSELKNFTLDSKNPVFSDTKLTVNPTSSRTVELKWKTATDTYFNGYRVYVAQLPDTQYKNITGLFGGNEIKTTEVVIDKLNVNQKYKFKVEAVDIAGNTAAITTEYNTPAEITAITDVTFEKNHAERYYPIVHFERKNAWAYKIIIYQEVAGQMMPIGFSDWIRNPVEKTITYEISDIALKSLQTCYYQVASANASCYINNVSWDSNQLVYSKKYEMKTPNAKPDKPEIISPENGVTLKPTINEQGEELVKLKAKPTVDYENHPLRYEVILYECIDNGTLEKPQEITATDAGFISYCEEIFRSEYPAYVERKIDLEYINGTTATLEQWQSQKPILCGEALTANEDGSDEKVDSPQTSVEVEVPTIEVPSLPEIQPLPPGTEKPDDEETPTGPVILVYDANQPVYLTDLYTYEEYRELVYQVEYDYYQNEFMSYLQENLLDVYKEESINISNYKEIGKFPVVLDDTGNLLYDFFGIKDNQQYAWCVKVYEDMIGGHEVYSDFATFKIDNSGPQMPSFAIVKDALYWYIEPEYIKTTTERIVRVTYVTYDYADTESLILYVNKEPVKTIASVDNDLGSEGDGGIVITDPNPDDDDTGGFHIPRSWLITLPDLNGEHIFELVAIDSAGNSTIATKRIILDRISPNKLSQNQIKIEEGNKKVTFRWSEPWDSPMVSGYTNIEYYLVTVNGVTWKIYRYFERKLTECTSDYNEKVDFSIKAVDYAGNVSATTTVSGYSLPQESYIKSLSQNFNSLTGQYQIVLELEPAKAACYQLKYGLVNEDTTVTTEYFTDPTYTLKVDKRGKYRIWVITYNSLDESNGHIPQTVESAMIEVDIENQAPLPPTTLSVPAYVNKFPLTLSYSGAFDLEGDKLTYYNEIIADDGQIIVEPVMQGVTEQESFTINQLENGKTYTWRVGVWDGFTYDADWNMKINYSTPKTFTVDLDKPIISVSPESSLDYLNIDSVVIQASDKTSQIDKLSYQWRIANSEDVSNSVVEEGTLQSGNSVQTRDGEYELVVTAIDKVGNTNNMTCLYKVDHTEPVIESIEIKGELHEGQYYFDSSVIAFDVVFAEDQSGISAFTYGFLPVGVDVTNIDPLSLEHELISANQLVPVNDGIYRYRFAKTLYNPKALQNGQEYYLYVSVYNEAGLVAEYITDNTVIIDTTGPIFKSKDIEGFVIKPHGVYLSNPNNLSLNFIAEDPEVGVKSLLYGIVPVGDIATVCPFQTVTELKTALNNLVTYPDGSTLQIVIRAENNLGIEECYYSMPFILDRIAPEIKKLWAGCDPTLTTHQTYYQKKSHELNLNFQISDVTGIAQYAYCVGSTEGSNNLSLTMVGADDEGWITLESTALEQYLVIPSGEKAFVDGNYYITLRVIDFAGNMTIRKANLINIDSNKSAVVEVVTNAYLTNLSSLGVRLVYPEEAEINGYRVVLYEDTVDGLQERTTQELTTSLHDYEWSLDYAFDEGKRYYLQAEVVLNDQSLASSKGWSKQILVDTTPPVVNALVTPSYSLSNQLTIEWDAEDQDYGDNIAKSGLIYEVKLGYTPGGNEIKDWTPVFNGLCTFTYLNLVDGDRIYATLKVTNLAGLSVEVMSGLIIIDDSVPASPVITHPYGIYTSNTDHLDFDWSLSPIPEYFLDHYEVTVSHISKIPENAKWINVDKDTSYTYQAPLINGSSYYLGVRAYGKNGLYSEGISDVTIVDFTKPDIIRFKTMQKYSEDITELSVELEIFDQQSEIRSISYAVGTQDNPTKIKAFEWESYNPANSKLTVQGNFELGEVYFFTVMAENGSFIISDIAKNSGTMIVKSDSPKVKAIETGGIYHNDNTKLDFSWVIDEPLMPYNKFFYSLVQDQANSAQWFETKEQSCSITPTQFAGAGVETFADGEYYLKVYCENKLGYATEPVISTKVILDTAIPDRPIIRTAGATNDNYSFTLIGSNLGLSGIAEYQYAFGSYPGGNDLVNWTSIPTTSTLHKESVILSEQFGRVFYLTAKMKNNAGTWSEAATSETIIVDRHSPSTPQVTVPKFITSRTLLPNVYASSLDGETEIKKIRWQIVCEAEKSTLENLTTSLETVQNSAMEWSWEKRNLTLNLTQDGIYYLGIQTQDEAGNWSSIGYSSAFVVDTIAPALSIKDENIVLVTNDSTVTIDWQTTESGMITYLLYSMGTERTIEIAEYFTVGDVLSGSLTFECLTPGEYELEMVQSDLYDNQSVKKTRKIRLNHQPQVTLAQSHVILQKGSTLMMTAIASDKEDGVVNDYHWKLVKSGVEPQTLYDADGEATFEYYLGELGEYSLMVTVKDLDAGTGTDVMTIQVNNTCAGTLLVDEIWSDANIVITGEVIVPVDKQLTILPGTIITFKEGTGLVIAGKLQLQGTETAKVVLKGEWTGRSAVWDGVKVTKDGQILDQLSYVTIMGAERGLTLVEQSVNISNAIFMENRVGIHLVGGTPLISDSIFWNNAHYGVKEDGGTAPLITMCGFGLNGRADYYDQVKTWITWEELNMIGNTGNYRIEGGMNP